MPDYRRILLIFLVFALGGCGFEGGSTVSIAADDRMIRYTGRWNFDDPKNPRVGWPGSTVTVRFRGSEINADVEFYGEGERLRIVVDGVPEEPARFIPAGRQTIRLASELDAGDEHTVVLMKEAYATSQLIFHGFVLQASEIVSLPPRPELRIAFFGDSNMEGYSLYDEKNGGDNGTYFAYPATVSRMLGAEMYLQAVGSATLDGPTSNDVVSFVYSEAYEHENFEYRDGFKPDIIVVNAGANDINRVAAPQREAYVKQNFRNAIVALRNAYGDEPHIILNNAFSWGLDEPANYSHEIVDEIGGNLSVHLFPWCWEQWHGDMVDHAGQANHLASYISSLDLGFRVQHGSDVFDGYSGSFDVANGSFEYAARDGYSSFGWRYFEDGVERVHDADDAEDGEYYIRLNAGELVHQCVDATGDLLPGPTEHNQQYRVTAAIRSADGAGTAVIGADYEQQAMYGRANPEAHSFAVTGQWQDYTATLTAPDGSWKTFVVLKSGSGNIEFDNIRLSATGK